MAQLDNYSKSIETLYDSNDKSLKLTLILLLIAFLSGSALLFIPVHYVLIGLIAAAIVVYLLIKPQHCYYLIVLTIPLTHKFENMPLNFSVNDILISICSFSVFWSLITAEKKINLKTRIDNWTLTLSILFLLAGITSVNSAGILNSFKFLEGIIVFYLTIYFIRTKKLSITGIIRVLIIAALIQALLGVIQSITGGFGANFQSNRGYLGRLGIGSTMVWHGLGTMAHFNGLGNLLTAIILFFIPVHYYILKRKLVGNAILGVLFWGLITTYSRGSLIGLFAGFIYFLSQIVKDKIKFTIIMLTISAVVGGIWLFLSQTSYVQTINPRDQIWAGVIEAIKSTPRYLWFGAGLNSYEDVVYGFLPPGQKWFAHNFYLITLQEIGIIGFIIFFSFLFTMLITTMKDFHKSSGLFRVLNLSVSLLICSIFFVSIYDHSYYLHYFKIMFFLTFGLLYAKDKKSFLKGI